MKEAFFFFAEEGNSRWTRLGNFSFPVVRMKGKNEFVVIIDGLKKVRVKMDALHFKGKFINNNILERMIEMVQKIICRWINNELNESLFSFVENDSFDVMSIDKKYKKVIKIPRQKEQAVFSISPKEIALGNLLS